MLTRELNNEKEAEPDYSSKKKKSKSNLTLYLGEFGFKIMKKW